MRRCHSNTKCKYDLTEFLSEFRKRFPQFKTCPDSVIEEKLYYFGEECCPECHSKRGTYHARDRECSLVEKVLVNEDTSLYRLKDDYDYGTWIKFYPEPNVLWAEHHLWEYDKEADYFCRVCGVKTPPKQTLCDSHEKKLANRLRKYRKLLEQAEREKELTELEFYNYSFKQAINEEIL